MDENVDTKKIEKALDIAHDIRKFEIELYGTSYLFLGVYSFSLCCIYCSLC
jgi:hypothetical protein